MRLSDFKQRFDRVKSLLGNQLGPDAKPLEIRAAVLDAIEAKVEPVGRGRRGFPYNRVVVRILVPAGADRAPLDLAFADLDARVRERFQEIRCDPPQAIDFKVRILKKTPVDWAEGQVYSLEYQNRPGESLTLPSAVPPVRVNVIKGLAAKKVYTFREPMILIGRTSEVKEATGRRRRNHVAFEETNSSVSRAHARLKYDPARCNYRLLDDGSSHGTHVIRHGETINVARRDPRGIVVQSGDEIQIGDASIRLTIG